MSKSDNVRNFPARNMTRTSGDGVASGGEPPYDGEMDARITKLEEFATDAKERLVKIESRLEQTATKADVGDIRTDLHKMNAEIKTWTLATMITIIGTMLAAIFGISQIFKSTNAAPSAPQQPAPIVIYAQPAPGPAAQPQEAAKAKQ